MTVTAKVPQTPLGPLLQSFFVEHLCSHKRVSPRTVESYRDTFRLLLQHLQAKTGKKPSALSIGDLDAPVILSFLENLEQQRHNQAQSRNVRLTAIRSFFRLVTLRDPHILRHTCGLAPERWRLLPDSVNPAEPH